VKRGARAQQLVWCGFRRFCQMQVASSADRCRCRHGWYLPKSSGILVLSSQIKQFCDIVCRGQTSILPHEVAR